LSFEWISDGRRFRGINRKNSKLTNCAVSSIRSNQEGEVMANGRENQATTTQTTQQEGGPQSQQTAGGQSTGQAQQTALSRREQSVPAIGASPFSFMRRFGEDMDRIFEDFGYGRALAPKDFAQLAAWSPQVEVFQRDGQLVVRAALPGLTKDDVQVELRDDAVILRGERRQEHEEQREGYYRCEVTHGSFYREIPLPEGVKTDNATATFHDGVLEITMQAPKQKTRGRQLQIQDASASGQPQAKPQASGANQ
jgi:HSP20 family protein